MAKCLQITFGKHAVRALLLARPRALRRVVLLQGARRYLEEFEVAARGLGIEPEILPRGRFLRAGRLGDRDRHQGIFVLAERRPLHGEQNQALSLEVQ